MRRLFFSVGTIAIFALAFMMVQLAQPNPLPPQSSAVSAPAGFSMPSQASQPSEPTITWSVPELSQAVFPGTSSTVTVSFQSDQDVAGVAVDLSPSLNGIVSASPVNFPSITAGRPYLITLTVTAPPEFIRRSFGGTIHLRNADTPPRTYSAPLAVNLQVTWNTNDNIGIEIAYPSDWYTQESTSSVVFSNVQQPSIIPSSSFLEVSYLPKLNPGLLPISEWFAQFSQLAPFSPTSMSITSIGGHSAIMATVPEVGADTMIFLPRGADIIKITLDTEDPQFTADYAAILNSMIL